MLAGLSPSLKSWNTRFQINWKVGPDIQELQILKPCDIFSIFKVTTVKKSPRRRRALFTPKFGSALALIVFVWGWGARIRTSITTSRAWCAAVAPLPNIFPTDPESVVLPLDEPPPGHEWSIHSSGRYCITPAKRGQVLFVIARGATCIIFHIKEDQQTFGDCLQTKKIEQTRQRLLQIGSKHIEYV